MGLRVKLLEYEDTAKDGLIHSSWTVEIRAHWTSWWKSDDAPTDQLHNETIHVNPRHGFWSFKSTAAALGESKVNSGGVCCCITDHENHSHNHYEWQIDHGWDVLKFHFVDVCYQTLNTIAKECRCFNKNQLFVYSWKRQETVGVMMREYSSFEAANRKRANERNLHVGKKDKQKDATSLFLLQSAPSTFIMASDRSLSLSLHTRA